MSLLQQTIGYVLKEVAQARYEGDAYTAELSQVYLQHETLQHFPIPRVEMENLQMGLRFAMLAEQLRPAVLLACYDEQTPELADTILAVYTETISTYDPSSNSGGMLLGLVNEDSFQNQWRTALQFTFRGASPSLVGRDHLLELNRGLELVMVQVDRYLMEQPLLQDLYGSDEASKSQLRLSLESTTQTYLLQFQQAVLRLADEPAHLETPVETHAERLQALPAEAISELRWTSQLENYQWTSELDETGQTIHHLQAQ